MAYRGFFNRYRKGMPFSEILTKDLGHAFSAIGNYVANGFRSKRLLVHPHYPSRKSTIYRVAKAKNYNVTNKISGCFDAAVYWEYATTRKEFEALERINDRVNVFNLHSRDIGKQFVDGVFTKVFGYSTVVDPLKTEGKLVSKSDINALHDGVVLQGPLKEFDEHRIYQILIDNSTNDGLVKDIRVPIVNGTLDFVYVKFRPEERRFENISIRTQVKPIVEELSSKEIELLDRFCKKLKFEYGELDVLRDNSNGLIYVVDINNTPQGPPENTSKSDAEKAIATIASVFEGSIGASK